jgi:hypothetical protein
MMELNQNVILIAVVAVGLLVCYFLWREVKRTQTDVQGLKVFSSQMANYIEPADPGATGGPTCEGGTCDITATRVDEEEVTEQSAEEKKDN